MAEASPPEFAAKEELAKFREWQMGGSRRELLAAFRAEADAAQRQAAAGKLRSA